MVCYSIVYNVVSTFGQLGQNASGLVTRYMQVDMQVFAGNRVASISAGSAVLVLTATGDLFSVGHVRRVSFLLQL